MLSINQLERIKKSITQWEKQLTGVQRREITLGESLILKPMLQLLKQCVEEIDRRNTPTPVPIRTSGPRPVVLDAQGKPVLPPPIAMQYEGERRRQYALDRHAAVMSLDPEQWRIFSLRWGLTPPPGGWDSVEQIFNVMHAVRLSVKSVPYVDKHFSAVHLTSKGIALPPGMRLENGVLIGHETDESFSH